MMALVTLGAYGGQRRRGQWGHRMDDMEQAQCVEARCVSGGRGNRATDIGLETRC
jgi:hypothetical protein